MFNSDVCLTASICLETLVIDSDHGTVPGGSCCQCPEYRCLHKNHEYQSLLLSGMIINSFGPALVSRLPFRRGTRAATAVFFDETL
jgi:hypothetical protein